MARRRGHWRSPVQAGGCVLLLMMAVLAAGSPPAVARAVEPVAASSVDVLPADLEPAASTRGERGGQAGRRVCLDDHLAGTLAR